MRGEEDMNEVLKEGKEVRSPAPYRLHTHAASYVGLTLLLYTIRKRMMK